MTDNEVELDRSVATASCVSGTTWNGSVCQAPTMSGTLTPASPSCTIAAGASACNVSLLWSTTNPVGLSKVTSDTPSANFTVFTGNNGTGSASVPHAGRNFFLYNNEIELDRSVATANCMLGTTWNGSTCGVNPPPPSIIRAYWLTPVYVFEGTVVKMQAQVTGFSIGDQFTFEIREDDFPLGSDFVTTKSGNVYLHADGNLYVDATWTTVWQPDHLFDVVPEFYFIVWRGSVSKESSRADVDEMHVSQTNPYGIAALEPSGIDLFSKIPVTNLNNLTDLANLKNNGLYYGSRPVDSTDRKLIIAIHGWSSLGTDITSIKTAIEASQISTGWRVIAYNWLRDADTLPTQAAERAYQHGLLIGAKILQQVQPGNLQAVHLIGHSAGSWAVYGALRYLHAHASSSTLIQVTYLDPFIPADIPVDTPYFNPYFNRAYQEGSPIFCRVTDQLSVRKAEQYWAGDPQQFSVRSQKRVRASPPDPVR